MITIGETLTNNASGEQVMFLHTAASSGGALLAFESLVPAGVAARRCTRTRARRSASRC